ncbi:MAG: DUF1571 domain-containing protein [Elusimicrobiota bacterium]|jgi:hypothetical protein
MQLFILFLLAFLPAEAFSQTDMSVMEKTLSQCMQSYAQLRDYTCLLTLKELIGNRYREENDLLFKFKKDQHFYFKLTGGVRSGTQVVFVKGKNDGKLLVRLASLLKFIKIRVDPQSTLVTSSSRHPLDEADIGHILRTINENYRKARRNNDGHMTYAGEDLLDGRKVMVFKAEFPKDKGYYGKTIQISIDKELYLPTKVIVYGWNDELLEMYAYTQCRFNLGLTEKDFSL